MKTQESKTFKKHHKYPNSQILCIGGTGTGKTNALLNFIALSSGEFYKIYIFSGSTTDEPLYQYLQEQDSRIELFDNIEDVPSVQDFNGNKLMNKSKLIIFDDWINLPGKDLQKIYDYAISGRKFNFTTFYLAQNYTSVPKVITRNISYFLIFKLNDNISINRILANHSILGDIDVDEVKRLYHEITDVPLNFMMIDLKTTDPRYKVRKHFG